MMGNTSALCTKNNARFRVHYRLATGIADWLELTGSVSVIFINQRVGDFVGTQEIGVSEVYFGGVTFGLNVTVLKGQGRPNFTLHTAVTLPTGTGPQSDHTKLSLGVTVYQDFDPTFVYGGVNVGHTYCGCCWLGARQRRQSSVSISVGSKRPSKWFGGVESCDKNSISLVV